jgi:hypothetical protein
VTGDQQEADLAQGAVDVGGHLAAAGRVTGVQGVRSISGTAVIGLLSGSGCDRR